MKTENILAEVKSKSLKDARDEISEILTRLESKDIDLNSSLDDYQRLLKLNKHIEELLRKKNKEISTMKASNQNDKK